MTGIVDRKPLFCILVFFMPEGITGFPAKYGLRVLKKGVKFMTNNSYDVIIIGAGPSGIFCAYELIRQKPEMKILMIEKGRPIEKRVCPKRTTKVCVGCKPCSITTGFAGAGAFSDGKLSLSPDVGGNLPDILGYDEASQLIHESDEIYLKFGADKSVYGVDKQKEI